MKIYQKKNKPTFLRKNIVPILAQIPIWAFSFLLSLNLINSDTGDAASSAEKIVFLVLFIVLFELLFIAPYGIYKIVAARKSGRHQKRVENIQKPHDLHQTRRPEQYDTPYSNNNQPQTTIAPPRYIPPGTLTHIMFSSWNAPLMTIAETEHVGGVLRQILDSVSLVNITVKPDVFFGRLHFTLDALLYLRAFEPKGIFLSSPTNEYNKILQHLEITVDEFIDRARLKN